MLGKTLGTSSVHAAHRATCGRSCVWDVLLGALTLVPNASEKRAQAGQEHQSGRSEGSSLRQGTGEERHVEGLLCCLRLPVTSTNASSQLMGCTQAVCLRRMRYTCSPADPSTFVLFVGFYSSVSGNASSCHHFTVIHCIPLNKPSKEAL